MVSDFNLRTGASNFSCGKFRNYLWKKTPKPPFQKAGSCWSLRIVEQREAAQSLLLTIQQEVAYSRSHVMIRIKRILCPVDLSTDSNQALGYALALTKTYDAKLVICYCASPAEIIGETSYLSGGTALGLEVSYAVSRGRAKDLFEAALIRLLGVVAFAKLDWEAFVMEGEDVGEAITLAAQEQNIDLIVMRSRRRPHRAAVLGSTAESVSRTAPCPVLVARPLKPALGESFASELTRTAVGAN